MDAAPEFGVGEASPEKRDGKEPGMLHVRVPSDLPFIGRHITHVSVGLDAASKDLRRDEIECVLLHSANDFTTAARREAFTFVDAPSTTGDGHVPGKRAC